MADDLPIELIRLAAGLGACFAVPFVAELGIRLARYVSERRAMLDHVDAMIEFSRGTLNPAHRAHRNKKGE